MRGRKEIRIAGFGGQGVGLAGNLLGKALCLYDGYETVMTQSYGPEARGGSSSANVVVADLPIAYPFVTQPDYLVTLSQEAYDRFRPTARADALILIDQDLVKATIPTTPPEQDRFHPVPATCLAEELGRRIVANVVMLGFFSAITGLVSRQAMVKAIESSLKEKVISLNLEAFEVGYSQAGERLFKTGNTW